MMADLATRIEELEEMVEAAKAMPLSSSVLLNRDEILQTVKAMKELLPEEIKQARWVVKDREELLAKARERSEEIIGEGRREQARLLRHEAVVGAAEDEARRIVAAAEDEALRIRREADDYVDARLEQLEVVLKRAAESLEQAGSALGTTTEQVRRGRRHLREEGS